MYERSSSSNVSEADWTASFTHTLQNVGHPLAAPSAVWMMEMPSLVFRID